MTPWNSRYESPTRWVYCEAVIFRLYLSHLYTESSTSEVSHNSNVEFEENSYSLNHFSTRITTWRPRPFVRRRSGLGLRYMGCRLRGRWGCIERFRGLSVSGCRWSAGLNRDGLRWSIVTWWSVRFRSLDASRRWNVGCRTIQSTRMIF